MKIKKGTEFLASGRPWSPVTQDNLCSYKALEDFNTEKDEYWKCEVNEEQICGINTDWYKGCEKFLRRGIDKIEKIVK